jgi:NAD-dependent deacetylase
MLIMSDIIAEVAELIDQANNILFITGAGISADSGLPTYRGVGGLYEDNHTEEGYSIEEALSGPMLLQRPEITWKYLWQIGAACHQAEPNEAHQIIASIQQKKQSSWVLTQNVDGLHRRAGAGKLVEIHGYAFNLYCMSCAYQTTAAELIDDFSCEPVLPPICPKCSGVVRPTIVLFSEMLPELEVAKLYEIEESEIDLVITIGTSGQFPYIIGPVYSAASQGIPTVEINPTETEYSHLYNHRLRMGAAAAMSEIWMRLQDMEGGGYK